MPRIGRLLLLGVATSMVFFSHFSFGREVKKSACARALSENIQSDSSSVSHGGPMMRFNYEKTSWLSQLKQQFHEAPSPNARGIDDITDGNLRRWTDGSGLMVLVIDPNSYASQHIRDTNHRAKSAELKKCKSIADGPENVRGLVACHPMFFKNENEWKNTKEELKGKNLYVDEENYYLVYSLNKKGEKEYFFSDMDLFAVFKMVANGAKPYFKNRLINQMNRVTGLGYSKGVQHPPRQDYVHKANLGFKFPLTAYVPGIDEPLRINDLCELKKFYSILNVNLEEIWSDYFARQGSQLCSGK